MLYLTIKRQCEKITKKRGSLMANNILNTLVTSALKGKTEKGDTTPSGGVKDTGAKTGNGISAAAAVAVSWDCPCGHKGNTSKFCVECGQPQPVAGGWDCPCGHKGNTSKFCVECGQPQPSADGWTCPCGAINKGKFCSNCGTPKPASAPKYKCDKCGWEPKDKTNPPKFCPDCGDPFDDGDVVK
jgi:membrane protease subunit (stomatin/prohibitin family)